VIKYLVGAAAMATVAFPSIACAQSSVTLYGIIENDLAYFSSSSAKLGGPSKHLFQAFSPLGEWGLTGAEDLGGGLKAIFTLENGFSGFNGAALQGGRMFGRQAFVGLRSSSFGTLTLGRQYDLGFDWMLPQAASLLLGGVITAHIGDNDNLFNDYRQNNSVKYASPVFGGFQAGAMYAFSNSTDFANNRAYNFGARYSYGPFVASANYLRLDNPSAGQTATNNPNGAVGGEYGLGSSLMFYSAGFVKKQQVAKGAIGYSTSTVNTNFVFSDSRFNYADGSRLRLDNYEVNIRYTIIPSVSVGFAYVFTDGKADGAAGSSGVFQGDSPKWNQLNFAAFYFLSKSTTLTFRTVYQHAMGTANTTALNLTGFSGGKTTTAVLAGIKHAF